MKTTEGVMSEALLHEASDLGLGLPVERVWSTERVLSRSDTLLRDLVQRAHILHEEDPFRAIPAWALVHHLEGDFKGVISGLAQAVEYQRDLPGLCRFWLKLFLSHGNISRAYDLLDLANRKPSRAREREILTEFALQCGVFRIEKTVNGAAPPNIQFNTAAVGTARRCAMVLDSLGVTDQKVRAIMDIAGEVAREHHLFLPREPEMHPVEDEDEPSLLIQYQVASSPQEAASLSMEVAYRLAERNAAIFGVSVSFLPLE